MVESEKFHSVRGWTQANVVGNSYGVHYEQCQQVTNLKSINSYAKSLGYITGFHSSMCSIAEVFLDKDLGDKWCTDEEDADHIFIAPSCSQYRDRMGISIGPHFFGSSWISSSK